MKENNNRLLWLASFIIILLFWILLGSIFINAFAYFSYKVDSTNIFYNSKLYHYILSNLPFIAMWLGFYFCFKYINKISLKKVLNTSEIIDKRLFLKVFLVSIIFFSLMTFIGYWLNFYDLEYMRNQALIRLIFIPIALIITPLQVMAEEILFRAIILKIIVKDYGSVKYSKKPLLATILISVFIGILFILPHLSNPELQDNFLSSILYYLVFGAFATFTIIISEGLETAIAIHLANNFMIIYLCNYKDSALSSISLFVKSNESIASKYFELITLIILLFMISFILKDKIKDLIKKKVFIN
ncbi:MAG: type II CAAX prenyl endopeptidase Rce1 family protein [Pleomorphochaeta sp.]